MQLFNPLLSPRCYAVIGLKGRDHRTSRFMSEWCQTSDCFLNFSSVYEHLCINKVWNTGLLVCICLNTLLLMEKNAKIASLAKGIFNNIVIDGWRRIYPGPELQVTWQEVVRRSGEHVQLISPSLRLVSQIWDTTRLPDFPEIYSDSGRADVSTDIHAVVISVRVWPIQLGLFTSCLIFICGGKEPMFPDCVEMRVRSFCGFAERGNLTETNLDYRISGISIQ